MSRGRQSEPRDHLDAPLRSPLRYPGGKTNVVKRFAEHIPEHTEYREVFVGGGAMFFYKPKAERNWINDLHPGLYAFYVALRDKYGEFVALCREQQGDLRGLFASWIERQDLMTARGDEALVERAVQFYFINKTVWGGRVVYDPTRRSRLYFSNPDGWSNLEKKFAHLEKLSHKLQDVKITCLSFEECLADATADTFLYVDPPYIRDSVCARTDRLYDGHFPMEGHELLAALLNKSKAKVMVSYDDRPEARALYQSRRWRPLELQWKYCGRYAKTKEDKARGVPEEKVDGQELLILNY